MMVRFWMLMSAAIAAGCTGAPKRAVHSDFSPANAPVSFAAELGRPETPSAPHHQLASYQQPRPQHSNADRETEPVRPGVGGREDIESAAQRPIAPESIPRPREAEFVDGDRSADARPTLDGVIRSVYRYYPPLSTARFSRTIAAGEQLAAAGEFDLQLKAASENSPTGFYQTYRQSVSVAQPTYRGGEVFAGYRIGRGEFEPWYQERQTNEGGEFKAGVAVPLSRNRIVDPRRAELWRSTYERQLVESDIQAQLIGFVQEASYAYWEWVAAGAVFGISQRVLDFAEQRTERVRRQVETGALDPPELTDNLRLVAQRRVKLADAARKLQQSAVKLSLYYRSPDGQPRIPDPQMLPDFPDPLPVDLDKLPQDTRLALQQRPEIGVLNLTQRQLEVDYAQAHNDFRPAVDAVVSASQDVGLPTSPKNDKGQFELDASLMLEVPVQRRKARGKMQAVQGQIAQLHAKRRFAEDKIVADVQSAYAAMSAAYEQVQQARQTVEYAEDLARRERRSFELGASDLLRVTLREQYAAESAENAVYALLLYHQARADYRAALALDRLP